MNPRLFFTLMIICFGAYLFLQGGDASNGTSLSLPSEELVTLKTAVSQGMKKESVTSKEVTSNLFSHLELELPTIDELQELSEEEVHHTPELIKKAAGLVGRIHQEAQVEVFKRKSAMAYFKECAENNSVPDSIRAICLNKIYKLIPEWRIATPVAHETIPKNVSRLAVKIL